MCHQSVGLIQSAIESSGIPTVSITLLQEITRKVAPPRALFVDYPIGYPLGQADCPAEQIRILMQALKMLETEVSEPTIRAATV